MKTVEIVILSVASTLLLLMADIHTAGHVFGWGQCRQEDLLGIIVGGLSGGVPIWIVLRQMNGTKAGEA